jgi:hypothetical protein
MKYLIIPLLTFTCLSTFQKPKDITGKWLVESVDASQMATKLTPQQKQLMNKSIIEPFTNAVFDFRKDHHFYLSANLRGMPKNDYWESNVANATITIREYNKPTSAIMKINITEKEGNTFFILGETSIILKVHKMKE